MKPYSFLIWATPRAFQTTVLIDVAYAAPNKPKIGINVKLRIIFKMLAIIMIFLAIFSFPVIFSKYITGPQIAFITDPIARMISGATPVVNSSPKKFKRNFGKSIIIMKMGPLIRTFK